MICLIAVAATAVGQQAQDALYIYRNDGAFNAFFFADIDRMEYSKIDTMGVEQDEYVVQEIYALDSVFRIPISAIDSIGFVTPETQYKSDVSFRDDSELWDYVIASDSASYFLLDVAIPERLVPRVGDKLVAIRSREFFPQGVYGRVAEVAQVAEGIMVSFDPLDFTELFDTWVCKVAVASVKEGNEVKRVKRRSSEEAVDVTIPLTSLRYTIDLSNIGYGITNEITLSGSGLLDVGVEQNLRVRAFLMVRPLLGLNFDLVQRLETNRFFKLDLKGSISGQLDVPFNKTWFLIPDTPFAVETQAGISFSATGEVELGMERQQVTSLVTTVQYNNSFYDYDPTDDAGQVGGSVNDVFSQSENTFKGTVTLTAGPYYGVWFSVLKKEVVKIGMRYDAGVKAEYSLDFQGSDLLFAAIPATLPAYMLINPTGLYDILNRDGSVKIGPFCTGKIEAGIGPWKTDASFLDLSTKWRGFEGGVVPKFSNTSAWIDPADNKLYAKTGIERRVVNSMPVGFAAYYAKSGKQASTNWSKYEYSGHPVNTHFASKEYTLEMPLFGAGKAVRVYPLVRLPMFGYEMLCSPYKEMTIPVEVKADPERIEVSASTHEQRFTFTDNLDRNEDTYERTVEIKCEKPNESDPDWIHGHWDGEDYVIKVDANTTPDARWGFLHVTTANADKSVRERITISVYQLYPEESDIHVEPTSLLFDADGGKKSFKVFLGEKPQYDAAVSDEGKNWCSVAKTVGPAVEVSVKPNPSTEDRACFVTCWVGNDDGSEKVEMLVKVVQQGKTVEPEPEPEVNTNIQSIYFLSSVSTKTYTDGETGDENSAVDETLMSVGFNFTQA